MKGIKCAATHSGAFTGVSMFGGTVLEHLYDHHYEILRWVEEINSRNHKILAKRTPNP